LKEDFYTGTKAAAAGGVTTVFEMPVSTPAVSSAEILQRRKAIVTQKAVVDFALYGGAGIHNLEEIDGLARTGVIGFKTFMNKPPKGREIEYEGAYVTDYGTLFEVLTRVAETHLPLSIHAEDNAIITLLSEKLKQAGRTDVRAHAESRPNFVEAEAISNVILLAQETGTQVHIAHLSTHEGVQLIKHAKAGGQTLTTETCPHYLLLTVKDMDRLGPYAKINPPLRSQADMEELWHGLNDGTIDILVSDHAPYVVAEKEVGWTDIWKAQSGAPTIETMLQLMLTKVNEGTITLERLVKVTSENVARLFNIYPKKGTIQVGSDADFVIVDLHKTMTLDKTKMYSKARDLNIYDGMEVKGCPIITIVRGEIVMKDGYIYGHPGHGEFVSPASLHIHKQSLNDSKRQKINY
jgi:allantoinase